MPAPQQIIDLVNRFERNYESYKSGNYNETQTRREFIDPFFEALGWDVSNKQGYAEAYKDVVHEYSQKTTDTTEAPDYLFRIGGTRKFFVEAKKPSVKLADDISPAYQLRRYAWTAKLPLSILTDFEEFAVYDCRIKPNKNDKPSTARINYYTYKDYIEKWDEIESIFSKDSILKGSFDKFAETNKGKRGTAEVDDAFLKEIEAWRETLAKNIALRNPKLSNRELNYSVQKIIDRIIFLRICEDRGIEEYGQLLNHLNGTNVYKRLLQIFTRADEKYNSGLFHFETEKDRPESPDEITPGLNIDDKTLKDIIRTLYYPDSPYEFSVLPADILGHVYEQFLGKVIRLTPAHQAKIDEKPEVKKAGGVYYTPTYIVDYIVKNTLGKLLTDDKTPKQVSKITVLDPACGSGSFLIVAYQYLLDWHLKFYISNDPEKHARSKNPPVYSSSNGEWKLTTSERKRILLNNIYGVDIDPQAVEVTKLSLLLKVLEGETEETLSSQFKFFRERALPDLGSNIKCGNSLIGPDFYQQTELNLITDEERMRINVFDWHKEFPEIFMKSSGHSERSEESGSTAKSGQGFDVVIGNPPWIFTKYVDWGESTKKYLHSNYLSINGKFENSRARQSGKINLYSIFILKGLLLLKDYGIFGNIIPNTILRTTVYDTIRYKILNKYSIERIVDLKSGVFKGVTASTIIAICKRKKPDRNERITIIDNNCPNAINEESQKIILQKSFLNNPSFVIDIFSDDKLRELFIKMDSISIRLGEITDVLNGIATYKEKAGIINKKEDIHSKPILFGKDINRYSYQWSGKYIRYIREELQRPRDEIIFLSPEKLIMQRIGGVLITAYDNKNFYTFNSINNLLLKQNIKYGIKYILAILNSKLLKFYYISRFTNKSGLTVNISKTFLDKLPIRKINFNSPNELRYHNIIENLANDMIVLKNNLTTTFLPQEKESLQRQIDATDREIDRLVYELYGLTEEEIKIVESTS